MLGDVRENPLKSASFPWGQPPRDGLPLSDLKSKSKYLLKHTKTYMRKTQGVCNMDDMLIKTF